MNDKSKHGLPNWGLPAFSWLISFYFLAGFVANAGFPPSRTVLTGDALYVLLWLFFLFLPFFSKVKIGGFLELGRQVEQAKEELREFKSEVRNSLSVLSTNVNTIGGMSNNVTVNIPGLQELREAREAVAKKSPDSVDEARQVEEKLLNQSEDTTLALARTRIEIERYLRKILGKRVFHADTHDRVKLMGARQLFEQFLREYPDLNYLKRSFQYVTQICNAAIHAQYVPDEQAQEALALGAQIIAALNDISGQDPWDEP
ncbi:hypothetical protein M0D45_02165 [Xanthomonas prunicola]|uniref:hypothetical protein n=1 Tax=Xanthomonas prunicola TaxID=2053930 RepID=UPI0021B2F565|nr:hypothetical protein [Xanthomonas prunicola]UXA53619.1 hypothetical protein M0D45_02165 [Xanthomonas prunicola]